MAALTTDRGGGVEGLQYLGIHLNHEVLLLRDLLVPHLDLVLDPAREEAFEDCRADVTDPLLGDLMDLLCVGHVVPDVLVAAVQEERDVLQRQPIVLGHRDVPDVLRLDACSNR